MTPLSTKQADVGDMIYGTVPPIDYYCPEKMVKKKEAQDTSLGVAWYRPTQWGLLKRTAADAIEDTYHEWLEYAEKAMDQMREAGVNPVRVDFDVEAFNRWCKEHGKPRNSDSRTEYVCNRLREKSG